MHITVLELLAAICTVLTFYKQIPPKSPALLLTDSTPAALSLTKSVPMTKTVEMAYSLTLLEEALARWSIDNVAGDGNPFADAVSRSRWDVLSNLCKPLGITPVQIPPNPGAVELILRVFFYRSS